MLLRYFIVTIVFWINCAQTANILCLFPFQGYSHFTVYKRLFEKLSERGHNVDVVGNFPRTTPIPRYTDLSLKGTMPSLLNSVDIKDQSMLTTRWKFLMAFFHYAGPRVCEHLFNIAVIKDLKKSTKKYDLIIAEVFVNDCLLGFAHLFQVPVIQCGCSTVLPWASERVGIPDNPSYIPTHFSPYTDMNIFQRIQNAFILFQSKYAYNAYNLEVSNAYVQDFFGRNTPHIRELVNNVSLLFVNSHFSLHHSRPLPPNVIEIGGIHIDNSTKLPKDLEDFLDKNSNGVIYFSVGSLIKVEKFPEFKLRAIMEPLGKLPYQVLWRGNREEYPKNLNIPSNIQMVSWSPQKEILCHPNVKLFISHGGLLGFLEAITCEKPILAIPIWADHVMSAKLILEKRLGQATPYDGLTKEAFAKALDEVLTNREYHQRNMKTMSKVFWDRPKSPLDTAVYWTEYVLRHKGAPHLRPKSADLPWYIYYCVDIVLVPVILMVLSLIVISKIVKFVVYRKIIKVKTQ